MFFKKKITATVTTSEHTNKNTTDVERSEESQGNTLRNNTYFDGMVNNFRSTLGTGILALPVCFSQGGYLGGIIGIILIAIITTHCALNLVGCQRELLRRNKDMIPTYQGTVQAAFAEGPRSLRCLAPICVALTNALIIIGQVGGICIDFVFISSTVQAMNLSYFPSDLQYIELIIFVPMMAASMVPNIKMMSILSAFGNMVILGSVGVVLYYVFQEPISFEGKRAFGEFKELPHVMGTLFFSAVTITFVLPMENEMKRPGMLEGPFGVLNTTAVFCSALYIFFGLMGYLRYGDKAENPITLNLPDEDWFILTVHSFLAVSAFTTSAILIYIGVTVVWDDYLDKRITKHRTLARFLLRISFAVVTLIVSLLVPDLKKLMALFGILMACTLQTTMPILINILINYKQPTFWAYVCKFWLDAVSLILTVVILISLILF